MPQARPPAVAGLFYPADPQELRRVVHGYLAKARSGQGTFMARMAEEARPPKALIAPHAGYIYSGPIAASAYATLAQVRAVISRVVLLGPAHRVPLRGLATSSAEQFDTPLGPVALDRAAIELALTLPQVQAMDAAHAQEHSLEVQLPFLQEVLDAFRLVPFVVGEASAGEIAEMLELLWGGPETLIVVSSDLSHYQDYRSAQRLDAATTAAIEALRPEAIGYDQACGRLPVSGLLELARRRGLQAETLDLRSSGDTAGPRDRVVGYGAYVFH